MKPKQTKGPWKFGKQEYPHQNNGWVVVKDNPKAETVPLVAGLIHHEADARLIAAAPEMLEALRWLVNGDGSDESWKAAEAAIAKAEGRSE